MIHVMTRNTLGLSILLFVLGTLSEIAGYVSMRLDVPGSFLMRVAGLVLFLPGFLLLLLYFSQKRSENRKKEGND